MCGTRLQEIVDFLGDHVTSICGVWRDIEINVLHLYLNLVKTDWIG